MIVLSKDCNCKGGEGLPILQNAKFYDKANFKILTKLSYNIVVCRIKLYNSSIMSSD